MEFDAGTRAATGTSPENTVAKIDKQFATRLFARVRLGSARMDTWLALHRLRLERAGRRAACELAAHPNRGVHRHRRIILHGRICQCHRTDHGPTPNS